MPSRRLRRSPLSSQAIRSIHPHLHRPPSRRPSHSRRHNLSRHLRSANCCDWLRRHAAVGCHRTLLSRHRSSNCTTVCVLSRLSRPLSTMPSSKPMLDLTLCAPALTSAGSWRGPLASSLNPSRARERHRFPCRQRSSFAPMVRLPMDQQRSKPLQGMLLRGDVRFRSLPRR